MTDTITTSKTPADRPLSGRRRGLRLLRSIAYDVRLVVIGSQTMADAVTGQDRTAADRLAQLTPSRPKRTGPGAGELFGHGVISSVLGALSWFLVMLLVMAVVGGPFYGLVEDGPFGAGTWGGPTKAGAWAAHAAISVPIVVVLLFAFRGIAWLHDALVRRLYGLAGRWVLPATISVCTGGVMLTWSWIQQL
jgi:hypothetical protein